MKRGLISLILVTALTASMIFGALGASCRFVSASYGIEKYTHDFYDEILSYNVVDSGLEGWFIWLDGVTDLSIGNLDKFVCAFESDSFIQISVFIKSSNFDLYSRQYVNSNDNYNGIGWNANDWYENACSFAVLGNLRFNKNNNYLSYGYYDSYANNHTLTTMLRNQSYSFIDSYWYNCSSVDMAFPCRDLILNQNISVYCNRSISVGADSSFGFQYSANLFPGSSTPPILDIYLKAFWLGERRYLTLTDQALVRGLDTDKDNSTWFFFNNEDLDYDLFDWRIVTWDNIVLIPGGENFVSGLTNVSPLGVYAYDITDLWWVEIASSYLEDDEGNIFAVALNTPFVIMDEAPEPGTDGQPSSETNIYQYINNYVTNYPSVTIVPQELASQLAGTTAYSSGTGFITFPDQLIKYASDYDQNYATEFRYDLSQSGLDPDEFSMLNFDLFNVVIVPGRIDVDYFYLNYWDSSVTPTFSDWQGVYRYTISQKLIDKYYYTNDLYESFDLVIFAPLSYFQDTGTPYNGSKDRNVGYVGDIGRYDSLDENNRSPMFWILTKSAIAKSQLFVFCDGFGKLYKLASDFCNKRDLWDSSFFEWSMSIFYQLQTIGGTLNGIKNTIDSWGLSEIYFLTLSEKLDNIVSNTTPEEPGYWYLPLYNFIKQFEPAIQQFSDSINVFDDSWDELPLLPEPSQAPAIPTLPGYEIRYLS